MLEPTAISGWIIEGFNLKIQGNYVDIILKFPSQNRNVYLGEEMYNC